MLRVARLVPRTPSALAIRSAATMAEQPSFYSFAPKNITGEPFPFEQLRGKVVLIVNTASKCGFTPQFEGLETLYKTYKDQGLVIVGFPSNQFANQDPGKDDEIASFCTLNYNVSFPMMSKICVNGSSEDPVWGWLKERKRGLGMKLIKWNFTKFLVDRQGNVVERFAPVTKPADIAPKIEELLAASA